MLEVECINVSYGEVKVLHDVSLKVDEGEIVSLVGANGAGKSTILRTISGLMHPTSGKISYKNERIENLPPHEVFRRGISHIPEGRRIFMQMKVWENIEMGLQTKEAVQRKDESLEFVHSIFPLLKERAHQQAGTLSGGEQQMLAIARGLVSRPKLLMLDEPSLGLAPILVLQILGIMQEIVKKGVTVLLVEQNIKHSLEISDRAYVLEEGRFTLEGTGEELKANPHVKKAYLGL
jgi:branched-chain amino acid transport system ATP-binding protein